MTSVLRPSTTPTCHYPSASSTITTSSTSSTSSSRSVSFTNAMPSEGFAFASIKGNVHLVQVHTSTNISSGSPLLEIKVFRHEFITIFRFSHSALLDPSEICILESIGDGCAMYEEQEGGDTVVLAKDLTERLHHMMSRRSSSRGTAGSPGKRYGYPYGPSPGGFAARPMYSMGMQKTYR